MEPVQTSPTLPEMQERFLADIRQPATAATYRWALAALDRFIVETGYAGHEAGPFPIARLGDDILVNFYRWLADDYSTHTLQTYLAAVQRLLVWLDAADLLPLAFQLGKAQNRLKVVLGDAGRLPYRHKRIDPELPRLVTYYDTLPLSQNKPQRLQIRRNRALLHTLYASGGRVSEVASLTREMALDGRLDEVHLVGKGGQPRVILLTGDAMSAIQAYVADRSDDYPGLFVGHGNRSRGQPLSRKSIWQVVKQAVQALGLHPSTSPHSFRHYRATQLLNQGMPLESVQAYLGHADISTTRKVYAHTQTSVLRDQLATYGQSPSEALSDLERRRRRGGK
jgi:integrase/recombinase XerD